MKRYKINQPIEGTVN